MERSGFFNSVNGDRKYKSEDFASYFNKFITNGVFPNPSTNLQIMAGDGMNVVIKAGSAWINGYVYDNTTDLILPVDPADGVLNRIDRIVLRYDTINREIKAKIKKGTFASAPVAPALQRDADAFELALADISIAKGVVSISQAYISDTRLNTDLCGIVNSLIQVDTTTLLNQYEAGMQAKEAQFTQDFNTWFATIQGSLDGDTAGNLLNLINNHKADKNNPHEVTAAQIGAASAAELEDLQEDFATHLAENTVDAHNAGNISASVEGVTGDDVQEILTNLFQFADNGKKDWANVIGSPLSNTDTFAQLKDKTQILKNTLATNLTAKGQASVGTEPLADLVSKVVNVSTGKKTASGSGTASASYLSFLTDTGSNNSCYATVTGLTFNPGKIIITFKDGTLFKSAILSSSKIKGATNSLTRIIGSGAAFQLTGNAYVNSTSFQIPLGTTSASVAFDWEAVEE